jgi:hypothetical protein
MGVEKVSKVANSVSAVEGRKGDRESVYEGSYDRQSTESPSVPKFRRKNVNVCER